MAILTRLIILYFSISLLSACNIYNVLKLRYANNDVEPEWNSTEDQMLIKTDYLGEKAFVYGSINGVDGFKFMIDTGASFTVLFDTPKINALNLPIGYKLDMAGWGDEQKSLAYQTNYGVT